MERILFRHVLRRLYRAPGFTAITLLTLAIGIGANTAVFSVVENVLLKPLPYKRPAELVGVWHTAPGIGIKELNASASVYFVYREESRTFQDIGLWTHGSAGVTRLGEPEQVEVLRVTDGTLGVLGVQPVLGRGFTRKDDSPGAPLTTILSYGYWQRRFAGDRGVIGRTIEVDGQPRQIIGVLPRGFCFQDIKLSLLLPFQFDRAKLFVGGFSQQAVARLKPGVTLAQASADVVRMLRIVSARFPPPPGYTGNLLEEARIGPRLRLFKDEIVGDSGAVLWIVMGTVGIVLLIACANIANLLLVRAEGRQHEFAIRAALGAAGRQIAGELLLESVLLGLAGGVLGLGLAYAAMRALISIAPAGLPRLEELSIDPAIVGFALAVSLIAGLLFGAIPVLKYAGPRMNHALRQGGRTLSQSRERHRTRRTLAVVQVALALVLLTASGLMLRTFQALRRVPPGFVEPEKVQTFRISIPRSEAAEPEQVLRMEHQILRNISAVPGVAAAAFSNSIIMDGAKSFDPVFAEDKPRLAGKLPPIRRFKYASPGFLPTLGNPILAGRDFTWTDIYNRNPVAIITENFAREYWGGPRAALGKRIRENPTSPYREIIGVTGNERDEGVNQKASSTVYWPAMLIWGSNTLVQRNVAFAVRSPRTGTEGFLKDLRQAVWSADANLPLASVRTLETIYKRSMARTSFMLVMLALAGGMALLLGVIGIYGVISYSVSQRTREIGIRMALGAREGQLTGMFVRQALVLAAAGLVFGLAAAAALTRLMTSVLFEISAADPVTYAGVAAILAAAAVLAGYVPSRRAAAVDPVEALRAE